MSLVCHVKSMQAIDHIHVETSSWIIHRRQWIMWANTVDFQHFSLLIKSGEWINNEGTENRKLDRAQGMKFHILR